MHLGLAAVASTASQVSPWSYERKASMSQLALQTSFCPLVSPSFIFTVELVC